ncbi:MAG: MFS transporter [Sideroxyarcus sp.]|nr:MFS transporter [Sideroxyarcus sp.]
MPRTFLTVLFLTVVINTGMGMIIPVIPTLLKEYGFSTLGLSLPFAALIIARIISKPWAGVALNRLGGRNLMLAVFVVYSLAFFLYPICNNPTGFIFLRILEGFAEGVGGVVLTHYAIVMTTGLQNRGVLMGYFSAAFGMGFIIGPTIGWVALETVGTTGMFIVGGAIGLLGVVVSVMLPQRYKESAPSEASIKELAANLSYLIPYIPSLLRRALFFSFMIIVPLFATDRLGLSAQSVGLLFTASGIISTACMVFTGKLADRFDSKRLAVWCLAGMGILIGICGFTNSVETFLVAFLAETLLFSIMLPAGTKVFAVAVDNHPLRGPMIGSFGSITEVFTVSLAFLLPAIFQYSPTGAWVFMGGLCVVGSMLLLQWKPALAIARESV